MGCDLSTFLEPEGDKDRQVRLPTLVDATNQFKIILVGDISVGKSSLVQRLLGKGFRDAHVSTIGTAFATVNLSLKDREPPVLLNVWDTAGEERYRSMSRFFFRGSHVGILVFDVQVPESLVRLKSWKDDIEKASPIAKFVVVANKIDVQDSFRKVSREEGEAFALSVGAKYAETSARTEAGVVEMFRLAAAMCLDSSETPGLPPT